MLHKITLPLPDAILGSQNRNQYRLLHLLGEGGTGSVFKAVQESTGQIVALKLLHSITKKEQGLGQAGHAKAERMAVRFERETNLCAQLNHPHIVKLLDKGQTDNGQLFAVFEFVPGETLRDLLTRKVALSAPEAGDLMGQVLDALACAHAQGIAHRDLKPHNIMVSTTGARRHVKVLDFGIASLINERQISDYSQLTLTQETMCSPAYSAPEQLRGEPPTVKMDLYAWGLLFLECLTGQPVISGSTVAEVFHQQLSSMEVPMPPALLGHPLAELLRRVLRKNPLERTANASLLYQDFHKINLANIVGKLLVSAKPISNSIPSHLHSDLTQEWVSGWFGMNYDKQQITVLCCSLRVSLSSAADKGWTEHREIYRDYRNVNDIDVLDTLQRDQSALCVDTAQRYGAHVAGALGNSLMLYFGYPHAASDDGRRAVRTALDLVSQVRRRSALLAHQGIALEISVGIHTGMVRCIPGQIPMGVTPNIAWQLERLAEPGEVLVSLAARKLLDQFAEFEAPFKIHNSVHNSVGHKGAAPEEINSEKEPRNTGKLQWVRMVGEHKSEALSFPNAGSFLSVMQGRENEFGQLFHAWERAKNGFGQTYLLQGEAGIGKSRLAIELYRTARSEDSIIREWRCLPEHQNNALYPVLEMLKAELHPHEADDGAEALERLQKILTELECDVAAILPIMCSWLSLPTPLAFPAQAFSPERQKSMLLSVMQKIILSETNGNTSKRPSLLIIEDIHCIDQTSLELLTKIIEASPGHAIMLLLTARPHFVVPWQTGFKRIEIQRLSDAAVEQLIKKQLAGKLIEATSLARLSVRTDGIPLYVEELTRMLLEEQFLVERNGVYQLDAGFDTDDIPITLRDLLSARLSRLGMAKETAQLAAVIGRKFDYDLLVKLSSGDEGALQTDIENLLAEDLIFLQRGIEGDRYIFRHALIRDAAYDAMSNKMREETHARVAHHLEAGTEAEVKANLFQLAQHFAAAVDFERAVKYGTKEAHGLLQRAAHHDAITVCSVVQNWTEKLQDNQKRIADIHIRHILTNAMMSKFGWSDEKVKNSAEQTLLLIDGGEDTQLSIPALWGLTVYHHVASNRKMVSTLTARLLAVTRICSDLSSDIACHTIHGIGRWIDGNYIDAKKSFDHVLANYDVAHHSHHGLEFGMDSRIWVMAAQANLNWFTEVDDKGSFAKGHEAVALAIELNHIPSLGVAFMYLAFLHQYANDCNGALSVSTELLALSKKYDLPAVEAYAMIVQCWATSNLALADMILAGLKNIGCLLGHTYLSSLAAEIAARSGDYKDAFARINACLALCDEIDEAYFKPELLYLSAIYREKTYFADQVLFEKDLSQAIDLGSAFGMKRTVQKATAKLKIKFRVQSGGSEVVLD